MFRCLLLAGVLLLVMLYGQFNGLIWCCFGLVVIVFVVSWVCVYLGALIVLMLCLLTIFDCWYYVVCCARF